MALVKNFYDDIFKLENNLIILIKSNLLNIYYLNGKNSVRNFYYNKYQELLNEYNLTKNEFLLQFLVIIREIIERIDSLTLNYRMGNKVDFNELIPLFLSNKMNNVESNVKTK